MASQPSATAPPLKTFIISLPERKDRRVSIYSQFIYASYATFEIVDAIKGRDNPGPIPPLNYGEIGLWASTIKVFNIAARSTDEIFIHIAEDDCVFSKKFFSLSERISQKLYESDIDILFTDGWARGRVLSEILKQSSSQALQFLPGSFYGGRTTSYIINAKKLNKVKNLVQSAYESFCAGQSGPIPIDTFYRQCSANGALNIAVCAPFLTSISQNTEVSSSDISDTQTASAQRWEDIHTLASQLPYIEFSKTQGAISLASIMSDLTIKDTADLINQLVPWLAQRGYITKARQIQ